MVLFSIRNTNYLLFSYSKHVSVTTIDLLLLAKRYSEESPAYLFLTHSTGSTITKEQCGVLLLTLCKHQMLL